MISFFRTSSSSLLFSKSLSSSLCSKWLRNEMLMIASFSWCFLFLFVASSVECIVLLEKKAVLVIISLSFDSLCGFSRFIVFRGGFPFSFELLSKSSLVSPFGVIDAPENFTFTSVSLTSKWLFWARVNKNDTLRDKTAKMWLKDWRETWERIVSSTISIRDRSWRQVMQGQFNQERDRLRLLKRAIESKTVFLPKSVCKRLSLWESLHRFLVSVGDLLVFLPCLMAFMMPLHLPLNGYLNHDHDTFACVLANNNSFSSSSSSRVCVTFNEKKGLSNCFVSWGTIAKCLAQKSLRASVSKSHVYAVARNCNCILFFLVNDRLLRFLGAVVSRLIVIILSVVETPRNVL